MILLTTVVRSDFIDLNTEELRPTKTMKLTGALKVVEHNVQVPINQNTLCQVQKNSQAQSDGNGVDPVEWKMTHQNRSPLLSSTKSVKETESTSVEADTSTMIRSEFIDFSEDEFWQTKRKERIDSLKVVSKHLTCEEIKTQRIMHR